LHDGLLYEDKGAADSKSPLWASHITRDT
jgi:hypothetical protein